MKIDITGQTFGRLFVIELAYYKNYRGYWKCQCSCENKTIKNIATHHLTGERTRSCDCLTKEFCKENFSTHGKTRTKVYTTWIHMLKRCENPKDKKYSDYGGRGIIVSEEWKLFENFYRDMGDPPDSTYSIDRIDNNGNYCKENCRWATKQEQARNRRSNKYLTFQGKTQLAVEWAEELNLPPQTIWKRLNRGWTTEETLSAPAGRDPHCCAKLITFKGETLSMIEWSRKLGFHDDMISRRIGCGWTIEEAITTPPDKSHSGKCSQSNGNIQ